MLTMFATKPMLSNADKTTTNKEGKGGEVKKSLIYILQSNHTTEFEFFSPFAFAYQK